MKRLTLLWILVIPLFIGLSGLFVQNGNAFPHIFSVEKITIFGLCTTVHSIETIIPGGHR